MPQSPYPLTASINIAVLSNVSKFLNILQLSIMSNMINIYFFNEQNLEI